MTRDLGLRHTLSLSATCRGGVVSAAWGPEAPRGLCKEISVWHSMREQACRRGWGNKTRIPHFSGLGGLKGLVMGESSLNRGSQGGSGLQRFQQQSGYLHLCYPHEHLQAGIKCACFQRLLCQRSYRSWPLGHGETSWGRECEKHVAPGRGTA